MAKQKIMIVDDDKNICELLRLYLAKEDFDTVLAYDGQQAVEAFESEAPDLVLLAFGMNDGNKTPQEFESYTRRTVECIRAALPECEFILVATSTPNPILTDEKAPFWGNQCRFRPVLDAIAADPAYGGGIAVADITGMQAALHSRKRFIDTTGNHVNHPNDFFHRLYAQFLCGMLSPEA